MSQIVTSRKGMDRSVIILSKPHQPGRKYTKQFFILTPYNNAILIPVFINDNNYFSNYFLIMKFYDSE